MIRAYDAATVRAAEEPLLSAGEPLMLRAAAALADEAAAFLSRLGADPAHGEHPRVLVLAGPGANGGDGLHAAALLRRRGIAADALAVMGSVHEGGAEALRRADGTIWDIDALPAERTLRLIRETDLVLDAILGIGGRAEAPERLHTLLDAVRSARRSVIAVDAPSFIDTSSGDADPQALAADLTVTFGAMKSGLLLPPAAHLCGTVQLVDIGLGPHLPAEPAVERLEDAEVRALWRHPCHEDSKYTRGVVALIAGSEEYPGAAVLSCSAAARTGAGMVRCLAPRRVLDLVLHARPEIVGHLLEASDGDGAPDLPLPERADALVVGPGLPPTAVRAREGVALLTRGGRLIRGVIDAGAIDAITPEDRFTPDVVLTPHRGEADRLAARLGIAQAPSDRDDTGDAQPLAPAALARALAAATGATVLLKGSITLIAPGDGGALLSQDDATPQLATAGTGDVLSGVIGTLLAAGLPGPQAAALGALLHGRAGRAAAGNGARPVLAGDLPSRLPEVIGTILGPTVPQQRGGR